MTRYYALFFFLVLTIPLFLWITAWQSNECGMIRNDIKKIESEQENYVKQNETITHEIVDMLAVDRLETEAQEMGLTKMKPENVILVIMGGKERGR